jgi:hypothetical protein
MYTGANSGIPPCDDINCSSSAEVINSERKYDSKVLSLVQISTFHYRNTGIAGNRQVNGQLIWMIGSSFMNRILAEAIERPVI